jgi:pimeloyl-ACP methyl ester carboxylesterase
MAGGSESVEVGSSVIPGPGHMVNVEAPERFNDEVRSFLCG